MKKILTYIYFFVGIFEIYSQSIPEKGVPFLKNYLPEEYGNHGKIWQISSAKNGLIYMASDNGLLEYDGETWKRYRDSKGFTRSLCIAKDSIIYTGEDMDFGKWTKDQFQKFTYTSLFPFKNKPTKTIEEFWNVFQYKDEMVFVSHNNLYYIKNHKLTKIKANNRFSASFSINHRIFVEDEKIGLLEFNGKNFSNFANFHENKPIKISGIYELNNNWFVVSQNNGIFKISSGEMIPFESEISPEIKQFQVFSFTKIGEKYLGFGTILNGLYITDTNGKIIQHLNKNNGLANNTVLSLFYAENGKLWMGLDYGISCINLKSNITYYNDDKGNFGSANTALLQDKNFYLGTNQGLYKANWDELKSDKNNPFSLIPDSEGQVWSLKNLEGVLYCGHDKGFFQINNSSISKISDEHGISAITPFRNNYVLTGNYNGISVYKKENNTLQFIKKIELIVGAVNQIVTNGNNEIWVNIPNYGVIKAELNEDFYPVKRNIFVAKSFKGFFPYLYKDKMGIRILTNTNLYEYKPEKNIFNLSNEKTNFTKIKGELPGFYFPIPLNISYGFHPIYNGFALENFNENKAISLLSAPLLFRKIQVFNNDENKNISYGESVSYNLNNIKIRFIVPNEDNIQYQYSLENYSKQWSGWTDKNTADFFNLKEGKYRFLLRYKKGDKISQIAVFKFEINAPWYRTIWSYLLYLFIFFGIVYFLKKYQENKLQKQKLEFLKKEQNSLREQAEKHRQEIILQRQKQLENEKNILKEQIKQKTIELANKAKEDDDKNRLLHKLKEKIDEAEKNPSLSQNRWKEMRRLLNTYLEIDDKTFEIQMDELHQEFFKAMKLKFPTLSIYDLRLCAYLKIGLNSKEMSEMLQVLPSSINVSRSRLRKKLGLSPEDDLFEFLNKIN